jgi:hypothetical protein
VVRLSQHPDEHRPENPILFAVDQQFGEGATLRVAPELSDPVGSLEVGEREDVEQFGGGEPGRGRRDDPEVGARVRPASSDDGAFEDVSHRSADLLDQASALFEGVDATQVLHLSSAADHVRAAAANEAAGDFAGFNAEMHAATQDLQASHAAIPSY